MAATLDNPVIQVLQYLQPKLDKYDREYLKRSGVGGSHQHRARWANRLLKYSDKIPAEHLAALADLASDGGYCATTGDGKPVIHKHDERTFYLAGVGPTNKDHYKTVVADITGSEKSLTYSEDPELPGYYVIHRKSVPALLASNEFKVAPGLHKKDYLWMAAPERPAQAPGIDWQTLSPMRTPTDHQIEGVEAMTASMADLGTGFILSDEMGTGKTMQAILTARAYNQKAVIVCPAGLRYNWAAEIFKTVPDSTVCVVNDKSFYRALQSAFGNDAWRFRLMPDHADFVIMSYEATFKMVCGNPDPVTSAHNTMKMVALPEVATLLENRLLILDEAHRARNTSTKRSQAVLAMSRSAARSLTMTGTPVDNRPSELWTMLCLSRRYDCFTGKDEFDSLSTTTGGLLEINNRLLRGGFFLRRLKKDVMKGLPAKQRQDFIAVMTPRQSAAYESTRANLKRVYANGTSKDITCMLALLTELQTISNEAKVAPMIEELVDRAADGLKTVISSTRLQPLLEIQKGATHSGVRVGMLTGDSSDHERRQVTLDFENGKLDAVLTTLAEGVNLQAADRIYLLDLPWTPGQTAQREDRIHRHGQTQQVTVVRVIAADIDRHKVSVITRKAEVAATAVDGGDHRDSEDNVMQEVIRLLCD